MSHELSSVVFLRCQRCHLGADRVALGDSVSCEAVRGMCFISVQHEVEKTSEELIYIPGDSLVACSFASYLGVLDSAAKGCESVHSWECHCVQVFSRDYRETATASFVDFLQAVFELPQI